MTTDDSLIAQFRTARRVSTPLVQITTVDPTQTIETLTVAMPDNTPVLRWDIGTGVTGINDAGKTQIAKAWPGALAKQTQNTNIALQGAEKLDRGSVLFMVNIQRVLSPTPQVADAMVLQLLQNLRDPFKSNRRMVVCLTPRYVFPIELAGSVVPLSDPLPSDEKLETYITNVYGDANRVLARDKKEAIALPDKAMVTECVDAIAGLDPFMCEQVAAMSLTQNGLDLETLWRRKTDIINNTPGLSMVESDGRNIDDVQGYSVAKDWVRGMTQSKVSPIRMCVWIDEIEKQLMGWSGEQNGIIMDQLTQLLQVMSRYHTPGGIFYGVPGAGKSDLARHTGVRTVELDLGALLNSLVGSSQNNIRRCMDIIYAMSRGQVLFLATANRMSNLPTELLRRFRKVFVFDFPTDSEKVPIWHHWIAQFGLTTPKKLPDCPYWTGSEIHDCCEDAWRFEQSLKVAASGIVPAALKKREQIEEMRAAAHNAYSSASNEGLFQYAPIIISGVTDRPAVGREIDTGSAFIATPGKKIN